MLIVTHRQTRLMQRFHNHEIAPRHKLRSFHAISYGDALKDGGILIAMQCRFSERSKTNDAPYRKPWER
jgi:hypothetical protein